MSTLSEVLGVDTSTAPRDVGLHTYSALAGLVIINVLSLSLSSMLTVSACAGVVLIALATINRPRLWFGVFGFLATMAGLFFLIPAGSGGVVALLSSVGYWFFRFGTALSAGCYVILTITPSQFVAGLHTARAPRFVTVPLTVLLRFIPQARDEFHAVKEAMVLRGIPVGLAAWCTHPLRTVEYLAVPLLVASSRLADDLSASGLVRGLGGPAHPTPMPELRFTWRDAVAWTLLTGLVAFSISQEVSWL